VVVAPFLSYERAQAISCVLVSGKIPAGFLVGILVLGMTLFLHEGQDRMIPISGLQDFLL